MVLTGLDVLRKNQFEPLKGKRVGLLCNQASLAKDLSHAIDLFYFAHQQGSLKLEALFGPQHGIWGHTQDNMIEWEGYTDPRTGLPIYSLYGEHRQPTPEMVADLDTFVIDLQDVGSRYYTFIWTMALVMKTCQEQQIEVVVLDRPNPIGGVLVEGPWLDEHFASFVGLHPLPVRHGLTIGEIARYLREKFYPELNLEIIPMEGWQRSMDFHSTGLTWGVPSPNMPLPATALVYPGMCLLEATNLSEGRGTTRPFEIFGAPWLDGYLFAEKLREYHLPGVHFRPIEFQPTFNKYAGEVCRGCFIHVTDPEQFKPFLTGIAIIREAFQCYPDKFRWKKPPYEYEYQKMPFDILVGNGWLRKMIEELQPLAEIKQRWQAELEQHLPELLPFRLYR